jgi:hypothetical protein
MLNNDSLDRLIWWKIDKIGLFLLKRVNIGKSAYMSLTHLKSWLWLDLMTCDIYLNKLKSHFSEV